MITMSVKKLLKSELANFESRRRRMSTSDSSNAHVLWGGDTLDVKIPKYIADSVYQAIMDGYTHYSMTGDPDFKNAIAKYYAKFGVTIEDPVKQVIINSGGSTGIFQSFSALINSGDEVILFDPTYSAYPNVIQFLGGKIVKSPLMEESSRQMRPNIEDLKERITPKTKAVLVCTPDNPTGCVYTKEELKGIADLAKDHDFVVVSDEIYQEFIWCDKPHFPIISLPDMEDRTIVVMSFSKTYVWTGCRVGCLISGPSLAPYISKIPISLGLVPGAFQRAGIVALEQGGEFVNSLYNRYREVTEYCSKRLDDMTGISCVMPEATFYVWPDISGTGLSDNEFSTQLWGQQQVSVRPGSLFGEKGKGRERLALVETLERLVDGMDRIETFVNNL